MDIVIIEDEILAANKLEQLVLQYDPNYKVLAKTRSIKGTIDWLNTNGFPDLLLMDIHLLDGNSFEILKTIDLECMVIFTTAYDDYALEAFKVNSIDYLLKPIHFSKLEKAFQKLEFLQKNLGVPQSQKLNNLISFLEQQHVPYKDRFLVKSGSKMFSIPTQQINHFYSEDGLTFLLSHDEKRFIISQSLEILEKQLDPQYFFRINRQMIIHIHSIKIIHKYFKGRLKIELTMDSPIEEIMVSSRRVSDFLLWLDQ